MKWMRVVALVMCFGMSVAELGAGELAAGELGGSELGADPGHALELGLNLRTDFGFMPCATLI